jgi:hypothetical protein
MRENLIRVAKLVGPYALVPIGVCLFLDYLQVIATVVKVLAGGWLALLGVSLLLGFGLGMHIKLKADSVWKDLRRYNLVQVMPSLRWGIDLADWLFQEIQDEYEEIEDPGRAGAEASGEPRDFGNPLCDAPS